MIAAVMEALHQPLVVRQVPDPTPTPDGAVIRVAANGVCRSDWHAWVGDVRVGLPHVLGHEFTGVVEAVGPEVRTHRPGDRVIVPFSQGDGSCEMCRSGHENVCEHVHLVGFTSWGGYAEYVAVPRADANLVRLPEGVGFVEGASMGCRFMTSFHGLVDQAQLRAGEWVAVHGCGGIGLAAIHIATALGASVVAVDISPAALELARELGAVATVNARDGDAAKAVRELTGGGAHVSVDALGIAATCRASVSSLRTRGRHLQVGLATQDNQGQVALPISLIVTRELQLLGTFGMQASRYPEMMRMVSRGQLHPGQLVTGTIPLSGASDVLAAMDQFATVGVTVIDRFA
ncbi:MAG TPA: zinc-dependent alcohol dehydrogenase family protein [Bacillota bacterium]|nr:zinc-dependent alcohol dehydrogenase family protein [Bacillota bacterium]